MPRPHGHAAFGETEGSFAYCPESWYVKGFGASPDPGAIRRLPADAPTDRHTTDRLACTDAVPRCVTYASCSGRARSRPWWAATRIRLCIFGRLVQAPRPTHAVRTRSKPQ